MVSTISATATSSGRHQAAPRAEAEKPLSSVVLSSGRDHLRRPVRDPDLRVLLLLPHPLDPVRHRVHRAGQLPAVLLRALPGAGLHQHLHLRLPHLRGEGRPRSAAGPAADLPDRGPRLPALGGLLPGPGLHHRHRHHLQDLDGPVRRLDQPGSRGVRHHRTGLVDRPVAGALQHHPDRRLEGRRHRDPHLHRRPGGHPAGVLRGGEGRRGQRVAELLAHHPAAGDAGHRDGRPVVADRWAALLRDDLGHHRRRTRLRQRRDRFADLQAVPGRLLRLVDGRQRDLVHRRHRHRPPGAVAPQPAGGN